jgi:protein-L-isoaspartate(D-aspartate) O-methyltransferase
VREGEESVTGGDAAAQRRLIDEVITETAQTASWTGRERLSGAVLAALAAVPRHAFVPRCETLFAYENRPLGIGFGQTISQPFIVAIMSELLDLTPGDRVLEVGTGSGYQSAVLAELAAHVFSIEVIADLAEEAMQRFAALGITNIAVRLGDGFAGWPEEAPFEAIIVTAAPTEIPPALVAQLAIGGRLVIPVGPAGETQMLYRCVKRYDGSLEQVPRLPVAFVPMLPAETPEGYRRVRR